MEDQTAIVIGGGVIGCSTAYFLSKQGWRVRVVDAGRIGGGCSHGNCGFICPSYVLPLTMPGALWPVLRRALAAIPQFTSSRVGIRRCGDGSRDSHSVADRNQ